VAGIWRAGGALSYAAGHAPLRAHLAPDLILGAVVAAVLFLFAYRISLWRNPFVTCRRCGGTGKTGGLVFAWSRSFCGRCGGHGLVPRLGTRLGYLYTGIRGAVRGPADPPYPDGPESPDDGPDPGGGQQWPGPWHPGR
jgi:hypothetical protein